MCNNFLRFRRFPFYPSPTVFRCFSVFAICVRPCVVLRQCCKQTCRVHFWLRSLWPHCVYWQFRASQAGLFVVLLRQLLDCRLAEVQSWTVARKCSIAGIFTFVQRELNILKINKISTDLQCFTFQFGGLGSFVCGGGLSPPNWTTGSPRGDGTGALAMRNNYPRPQTIDSQGKKQNPTTQGQDQPTETWCSAATSHLTHDEKETTQRPCFVRRRCTRPWGCRSPPTSWYFCRGEQNARNLLLYYFRRAKLL